MQTDNHMLKRNSIKKAIVSALVSFTLFTVLYHLMIYQDMVMEKERYSYIAKNQAEHIITTIDCVMSRTNTLTTMVKDHNGETAWFDNVAEDIYATVKEETGVSLKNFAIAPDGVVSNVYPLNGNEQLIGFDFLDTSREGNLEAKEAYENGKTIITNPFELIQGGIGMGGRAPVVFQNNDGSSFWGLVTVTIDFENLIEVLGLDNLRGMGVDYSLSYIDPDGRTQFMYGGGDIDNNAVKTQFNVRNLTWEIAVEPSKGWISVWKAVVSVVIIMLLSCIVGVLTYMMIHIRNVNTLLLHMSATDALTDCYNRRAYEDKLRELALKKIDNDFVCVSADLNGLKQINDNLGHAAGDEAITGASKCLQKGFGPYGSLYRTGGDEFVALIWVKEEPLSEIIENVNSIINGWKGQSVAKISVSIGYASHREFPDRTIDELSRIADIKMYEAKSEYYRNHDRRIKID
jgi:diguanylate cyclase (GGDEF)-like protein